MTAQGGPAGRVLRSRVQPTKKTTTRIKLQQRIFRQVGQAWSNELTQAQRDGWSQIAQTLRKDDADDFGQALSGFNLFRQTQILYLNSISSGIVTNPPPPIRYMDGPITWEAISEPGAVRVFATFPNGWFSGTAPAFWVKGTRPYLSTHRAANRRFTVNRATAQSDEPDWTAGGMVLFAAAGDIGMAITITWRLISFGRLPSAERTMQLIIQ